MNSNTISQTINKVILTFTFLFVTLFSILLSNQITWESILFSLFKGVLAVCLGWYFFLILGDTLVKSISSSAAHARARRLEGGLVYHFLQPDKHEILEETQEKSPTPSKS